MGNSCPPGCLRYLPAPISTRSSSYCRPTYKVQASCILRADLFEEESGRRGYQYPWAICRTISASSWARTRSIPSMADRKAYATSNLVGWMPNPDRQFGQVSRQWWQVHPSGEPRDGRCERHDLPLYRFPASSRRWLIENRSASDR